MRQNVNNNRQNILESNIFIFIDLHLYVFLQSEQNIVASFDRKGEYIYTGNSKGKVSEFNCRLMLLQNRM